MNQSWFKCKFKKAELDGRKIAFHVPGEKIGRIGLLHVSENPSGELFIEILWGGINRDGQMEGGKMAIAQDWIDRIQKNSTPQIPAEFIIPQNN
jgi:hypothetical protein